MMGENPSRVFVLGAGRIVFQGLSKIVEIRNNFRVGLRFPSSAPKSLKNLNLISLTN
ncbi:MAG: hypothetical protein PHX72_00440 [Candidatus Shapirobacteria bacterium]|nr:hypothetical protein [Candidatus Shapirobacteria bacterium]